MTKVIAGGGIYRLRSSTLCVEFNFSSYVYLCRTPVMFLFAFCSSACKICYVTINWVSYRPQKYYWNKEIRVLEKFLEFCGTKRVGSLYYKCWVSRSGAWRDWPGRSSACFIPLWLHESYYESWIFLNFLLHLRCTGICSSLFFFTRATLC